MAKKSSQDVNLNVPGLSYRQAINAIVASLEDNTVPALLGPPGVGKTAMRDEIAKRLKLTPASIIPREHEAHEISGIFDVNGNTLKRHIFDVAKLACDHPTLVLVDEATVATPPVFAAISSVVRERRFGDYKCHPGTRFMLAANDSEHALEACDLPLPLINRLRILRLNYTVQDFQHWCTAYKRTNEAIELSAILDARPELLEIDPPNPEEIQAKVINWASPRAWEQGLQTVARANNSELDSTTLLAMLVGDVGPRAANAYMAIRALYKNLPTVTEVVNDPVNARLPKDFLNGVGMLGIIAQVCNTDPCAAFVYSARLDDRAFQGGQEIRTAAANTLSRVGTIKTDTKSPWEQQARQARIKLGVDSVKTRGKV